MRNLIIGLAVYLFLTSFLERYRTISCDDITDNGTKCFDDDVLLGRGIENGLRDGLSGGVIDCTEYCNTKLCVKIREKLRETLLNDENIRIKRELGLKMNYERDLAFAKLLSKQKEERQSGEDVSKF